MPLPSSIQSVTLKFTKGNPPTLVGTQTIPLGSINVGVGTTNSVKIDSTLTAAFNTEPEGTIFTPSIVVDHGNNLTIANLPASSVPSFVPRPPPLSPLSLLANGVTIRHNGLVTDIPSSTPLFIYANPRGTGDEWFAVVKDGSMKSKITDYSRIASFYSGPFIPPEQTSPVPFKNIVTTHMTDMSSLLTPGDQSPSFNQDITSWDTSKVTNMSYMFYHARSFNQNISLWNTSNVTDMSSMFSNCQLFNQPIGSWDTSKVTDMSGMFYQIQLFNQNISSWDISKVTNIGYMFYQARSFNQNISLWNTSNVTDMSGMFSGAQLFNQNISSWNTSKVTNISYMFNNAYAFNQPINTNGQAWNTSNVTNMDGMFWSARMFNQNIGSWDTSKVTKMSDMFNDAEAFNQDISSWQVYRLTSRPNRPSNFYTAGATGFHANPSYLPNWGMAAPAL